MQHVIDAEFEQDNLGGTSHQRLGSLDVERTPLDVPRIIADFDSLLQLRMYSKLRNYAGTWKHLLENGPYDAM